MGTTYKGFNSGCTVVSETEKKLIRDNQSGCEILSFFFRNLLPSANPFKAVPNTYSEMVSTMFANVHCTLFFYPICWWIVR